MARVQQNFIDSELELKLIQELCRLCLLYGGIDDTPRNIMFCDSVNNITDIVSVQLVVYEVVSQSGYFNQISELFYFGLSHH